jgi:cell wall-associated NlpC family hydrolase
MMLLLAYAESLLGTPYKWGGNNPLEGLDCSGLVNELLRSVGELGSEDLNAQGLFDKYHQGAGEWNRTSVGSLAFFGESVVKITHVAMVIDVSGAGRIIEAGHGSSLTLTYEDAARRGAFVRVRPLNYRKDLVAIIRPYYRVIGMI